MGKVNLLTQSEYAAHRGMSAVAVHKAVKAGRISLIGDKIDPTVADIQWEQNTRPRARPQRAAAAPVPTAAGPDLVEQATGPSAPEISALDPLAAPAGTPASTRYTDAVVRVKNLEAEQREVALKRDRGELVSWEDVLRGGFEVAREVRDTMTAAENQLAAELAAVDGPEACLEVLRRHHRAICDVLVRGWREKVGPLPSGGLL